MILDKKKILVTGGCGFIGSHFINESLKENVKILNLDNLSYSYNNINLKGLDKNNYSFIKGDVNNKKKIKSVFKLFKPDIVINFAAETHVDRSIESPNIFVKTNIIGTCNLLEESLEIFKKKKDFLFIQISTDEVFGSLNFSQRASKEEDSFNPSSPYSATKASADLIARAWFKTFKLPVITIYPTNNFGPAQYPEKFIPLMILKKLQNKKLTVYGDGKNIREWIYVKDCVGGIIELIKKGKPGESYNLGSGEQLSNKTVAELILKFYAKDKNKKKCIQFVKDRPAHDLRYNLNCSKIKKNTKWKPLFKFKDALRLTIQWYKNNSLWLTNLSNQYGIKKRIGIDKKKKQ